MGKRNERNVQNGNATHGRFECFSSATSVRLSCSFSYVFKQQQQRQQLENDGFVPRQTEPPEFVTNEAIACAVRRRCTPFLITQVRVQLDSSSSSSTYDGRAQRRLRS